MITKKLVPLSILGGGLFITALLSKYTEPIFTFIRHGADPALKLICVMLFLILIYNFITVHIAKAMTIPSFVIAIIFGVIGNQLFTPITQAHTVLGTFVALAASLFLFSGGLEIPLKSFIKNMPRILSIAFFGVFITGILLSGVLSGLNGLFNSGLSMSVIILLGAVLASTDPAAIIPVLNELRFYNKSVKDIVISESAVNDVVGTLLTVVFLTLLLGGQHFSEILTSYQNLISKDTLVFLAKETGLGILFGIFGFVLLKLFLAFKSRHKVEIEADSAYFIAIPVVAFVGAIIWDGSGYLAAFIAGLLFAVTPEMHKTEHFFLHTIEGFIKPTLFLLLGALVDPATMVQYAGIGIISALIFMLIIRPVAVFITLGPFTFIGKHRLTVRELLFISFVRETGAIPAVLLVTIASSGLPGCSGLVPVGMWVILATLIIAPPVTPWVAKALNVAESKA